MLSKRIRRIEESGVKKVLESVADDSGEYINLSIDSPRFEVPSELKEFVKKAIDESKDCCPPSLEMEKLRKEISEKLQGKNEIESFIENVIITPGSAEGFFLAVSACLDEGDEVILMDPYSDSYKKVFDFLGVQTSFLDTYPDFHINCDKLERLVTPRTKAIVLNSPNNPTGAVYSKEELAWVSKIAKLHDLTVISDETFEKFDYEKKFFSIGSIYEKTITIGSFSKSHFATGWRVGFVHAPIKAVQAMDNLRRCSFSCAPNFFQYVANENSGVSIDNQVEECRKNAELVYEKLRGRFRMIKPEGAFYVFVEKPEGRDDFVEELLEKKVVVAPGGIFSESDDFFRISFATDSDVLEKGLDIINSLL